RLCVAALQRELRTEPEAEPKALYQEILRGGSHVLADRQGEPIPPVSARPIASPTAITEPPPAWEPPLAGRHRDVARLREALDRALAGRGRLVVLIGEAGAREKAPGGGPKGGPGAGKGPGFLRPPLQN